MKAALENDTAPFNDAQVKWLVVIFLILNICSVLGTSFVALTNFVFKNKYPVRLAIYFALCTGTLSLVLLIGWSLHGFLGDGDKSTWLCHIQGSLNQFLNTSALFWWFFITVNMYSTFVLKRELHGKLEAYMHLISWGLPFILTVIPASLSEMYFLGMWCWIAGNHRGLFQFIFYYVPLGAVCLGSGVLWAFVVAHLFRRAKKNTAYAATYPLPALRYMIFTFIFLVMFSFTLMHRLYIAISDEQDTPYALLLMNIVCTSSQGFFSFLAFGLKRKNASMWYRYFYIKYLSLRGVGTGQMYEEIDGQSTTEFPRRNIFEVIK